MNEKDVFKGEWIYADTKNLPLFFRKFVISRNDINSASLKICGLGFFRVFLNENEIDGEHFFKPNVSDYHKRDLSKVGNTYDEAQLDYFAYYLDYDIKNLISKSNELKVVLGNGWYEHKEKLGEGDYSYGKKCLKFCVEIEYLNGQTESFYSDEKTIAYDSQIISSTLFEGEVIDKNAVNNEYKTKLCEIQDIKLLPQISENDKVIEKIDGYKIKTFQNKNIYDFKKNHSGFIELKLNVPKNRIKERVIIKYSENITAENELDTNSTSWCGPIQKDEFILKEGYNEFQISFAFHSYRYAEVEISNDIEILSISSLFISCGEIDSLFDCSNEVLSRLYKNFVTTQLSNMHYGFPSDCPHREKRGYTGDGQVASLAAMYALNAESFYKNWAELICQSQDKLSGYVPFSSPFSGGGGGYAWGSAVVIIPYNHYLIYHDTEVLKKHYASMEMWIKYLDSCTESNIIRKDYKGWLIGEWCNAFETTISPYLVNTFYYARCVKLMSEISDLLKIKSNYSKKYDEIAKSFHNEFFDGSNFGKTEQGEDVFAYFLGLEKELCLKNIKNKLLEKGYIDTGIFGTPLLYEILIENNESELLFKLLDRDEYPSIKKMVADGETTLWECWNRNSCPPFKSITNHHAWGGYPTSLNHPMFGSISRFCFTFIAGINIENLYKNNSITIKPFINKRITFFNAEKRTKFGKISVSLKDNILEIELPTSLKASAEVNGKVYSISGKKSIKIGEVI